MNIGVESEQAKNKAWLGVLVFFLECVSAVSSSALWFGNSLISAEVVSLYFLGYSETISSSS